MVRLCRLCQLISGNRKQSFFEFENRTPFSIYKSEKGDLFWVYEMNGEEIKKPYAEGVGKVLLCGKLIFNKINKFKLMY